MNTERLLKLADFLETIPVAAFSLKEWEASKQTKAEGEKPGDCGFAGCAVGWAAHSKMFEGFEFAQGQSVWGSISVPTYRGERGWNAVKELFDISSGRAYDLFDSSSYSSGPHPSNVAARIRNLVATSCSSE